MKVVLKKCWNSGTGGIRTDRVYGEAHSLPEKGHTFRMLAEPLATPVKEGFVRYIETSNVQAVMPLAKDYLRFYTENSVYELEIIPEEDRPHVAA